MFTAAFNGPHRHFTMISINFTPDSRMWQWLSSIAIVRKGGVLDVPDGKETNELTVKKTLNSTHQSM